jgi:hypothetical protein
MQLVSADFAFQISVCATSHIGATGRDNGDCNYRFEDAAQDVVLECDRSKCSPIDQEYFVSAGCKESCFKASCDWSKSMCSNERANLAKCPLFDSTVLSSIRLELNQSLKFVDGGTAR